MKGIRISKEGYTVNDSGDKQYVDTDEPLFKLFLSDKGQIVLAGASPVASPAVVIPHNLGYVPMFFIYMDRSSNANRKLVLNQDAFTSPGGIVATAQADTKNITVFISGTSVTGTFGYNYQIYYDKVG